MADALEKIPRPAVESGLDVQESAEAPATEADDAMEETSRRSLPTTLKNS
jgi:hypothetical protein